MGVDIFVPSLPHIVSYFHTFPSATRLTVTLYVVGYGCSQLFFGILSDAFGRRNLLILSLIGFVVTGLVAPEVKQISTLVTLRFFQGIFAGGIGVMGRVILTDSYTGHTLAKYAVYMTIGWAIGPIIAPYIGGYLQEYFGWKASFLFLTGYSFLVLVFVVLLLVETLENKKPLNFQRIIQDCRSIATNHGFMSASSILGLIYGIILVFNVAGPFLIQSVLHYNAIDYGRIALVLGLCWFMGSLICRLIVTRLKMYALTELFLSLNVGIASLTVIFGFFNFLNLWTLVIPTAFIYILSAIVFSYCYWQCLSYFPQIAGTAGAAMGSIMAILGGLLSSIVSFFKIHALLPFALAYLVLTVVLLILYSTLAFKQFRKSYQKMQKKD